LNYREVRVDLLFFMVAYGFAVACAFVASRPIHYAVAVGLVLLYVAYMYVKFSGEHHGEAVLEPLFFARRSAVPSYLRIGLQGLIGLIGLAAGAHLFVTAAKAIALEMDVSPLLLALLIAPLATELPEMSNSFLWLYNRKDTLAVGNVTGAMVFQGTFPVSVGLIGTGWQLSHSAVVTMALALVAVGVVFGQLVVDGHWRPWVVTGIALLYLGFMVFVSN
jgi:cation:H+ antiporter